MRITNEQLKALLRGTVEFEEVGDYIQPHRFTTEQHKILEYNDWVHPRSYSTPGARLAFRTNSKAFSFEYSFSAYQSDRPGPIDIVENGVLTAHVICPQGEGKVSHTFEERVADEENPEIVTAEIYLPYGIIPKLRALELDDGAFFEPAFRKHKLLVFGDSITHGDYTVFPSESYIEKTARMLDADIVSKAIGGDKFYPPILDAEEPFEPDFITVAYGTNDWRFKTYEQLTADCGGFYKKLSAKYPKAKIFAVTPLWRADFAEPYNYGRGADTLYATIRELCADLPNVIVIDGWRLLPHHPDCYRDQRLHPNGMGMAILAQNLYMAMKKHL